MKDLIIFKTTVHFLCHIMSKNLKNLSIIFRKPFDISIGVNQTLLEWGSGNIFIYSSMASGFLLKVTISKLSKYSKIYEYASLAPSIDV